MSIIEKALEKLEAHAAGEPVATEGTPDGATDGENLDLEPTIDGAETTVLDYRAGCPETGAVSLWSIEEGRHLPTLFPGWALPMGALDWMGGVRKD